eukprot:9590626-Alexandrium_andersonii.AAC.1
MRVCLRWAGREVGCSARGVVAGVGDHAVVVGSSPRPRPLMQAAFSHVRVIFAFPRVDEGVRRPVRRPGAEWSERSGG